MRYGNLASLSNLGSLGANSSNGSGGSGFSQITESWANLASWSPSNANQVSSGKVYATTTGALAGASQAFAIGASTRLRYVTSLIKQGTQDGLNGIGLTQITNGAPMTGGAPNTVIFGLLNGVPYCYSNVSGISGGNLSDTAGANAGVTIADGTYVLVLTLDETDLTFSLVNTAHSIEYKYRIRRSSITTNAFTGIAFWNSGSTGTSGNALGPLGAHNGGLTISPRTGIEGQGDSFHLGVSTTSQNIRITVPKSYDSAVGAPMIMCNHGSGDGEQSVFTDSNLRTVVNALLDAGYIVASTGAHGNNWGNQASIDDHYELYNYVRAHYNVKRTLLMGQSMGGLALLLTLAESRILNIKGWLGIYPVCNLANIYGLGVYTSQIDTAYGISGGNYASKTAGHDPALMAGSAFRNIPMRFYASAGDTAVPKAQNSDALNALLSSNTAEHTVVVCTGNHGDASHFQPSDVVDFFSRCV